MGVARFNSKVVRVATSSYEALGRYDVASVACASPKRRQANMKLVRVKRTRVRNPCSAWL